MVRVSHGDTGSAERVGRALDLARARLRTLLHALDAAATDVVERHVAAAALWTGTRDLRALVHEHVDLEQALLLDLERRGAPVANVPIHVASIHHSQLEDVRRLVEIDSTQQDAETELASALRTTCRALLTDLDHTSRWLADLGRRPTLLRNHLRQAGAA